jgi:Flavinator of succinate dehydrogenase
MTHTPEHIASTTLPADTLPPKPLPRPGEPIETTRARLIYQSRKRGTLESDLLLSTFAREHLGTMDAEALSEFDKVRHVLFLWVRFIKFMFLAYGRIGLGHLLLGYGKTDTA